MPYYHNNHAARYTFEVRDDLGRTMRRFYDKETAHSFAADHDGTVFYRELNRFISRLYICH